MTDSWTAHIEIRREYVHHHADVVLDHHPGIRALLETSLVMAVPLTPVLRRNAGVESQGIGATELNRAIKGNMQSARAWRFEAVVRDGVILDNASNDAQVRGFDFAMYDVRHNLANLWSLCFGRRGVVQGDSVWQIYLASNPGQRRLATEIESVGRAGEDLESSREAPTILGEVQFGNWALAYRDMMKLLAADAEIEVDLFVYVVADASLARLISTGTVNFEGSVQILRDFRSVLKVPTVVVGLDVELTQG
ncbi:MAG: hypothetical protein M3406_10740 [Chloroflexota bacterium]|nr:hypothetical protein [Chloroflexota bacterium]